MMHCTRPLGAKAGLRKQAAWCLAHRPPARRLTERADPAAL